jgi:hypothetical protein
MYKQKTSIEIDLQHLVSWNYFQMISNAKSMYYP